MEMAPQLGRRILRTSCGALRHESNKAAAAAASTRTTTTTKARQNLVLPWLRKANLKCIFMGCPGVGKGTYAARLSQHLQIPHISTGDLIRAHLQNSAKSSSSSLSSSVKKFVAQGKLVPDELILQLLANRLHQNETAAESGFILDGFPRTLRQAHILQTVTDVDVVVNLRPLREDVVVAKCLGRRICIECGETFNVASVDLEEDVCMPPLLPPPECEAKLQRRCDDTEVSLKERFRVYHQMSRPIEDFYRRQEKIIHFTVDTDLQNGCRRLLRILAASVSSSSFFMAQERALRRNAGTSPTCSA